MNFEDPNIAVNENYSFFSDYSDDYRDIMMEGDQHLVFLIREAIS